MLKTESGVAATSACGRAAQIRAAFSNEFIWIAGLSVLLVSLISAAYIGSFPFTIADDAYIHFRIAEHYAESGFPYFNTGEPVMSTSSPVWTVVLSLTFLLHLKPEYAVFVIELCAVVASFAAAVSLFRDCGHDLKWACLGGLAVVTTMAGTATSLMETPLAITFLLFAAACAMRGNWLWGPLAALAACTRLEYGVAVVTLGLAAAVARKPLIKPALSASLVFLAFGSWSLYYFRTVIPNTVAAKATVYAIPRLHTVVLQIPGVDVSEKYHSLVAITGGVLILLSSALIRTPSRPPRKFAEPARPIPWALFFTGLLIFAVYTAQRVLVFEWYVPLTVAPFIAGLCALAPRPGAATDRNLRMLALGVIVAPFVAMPARLAGQQIAGDMFPGLQEGGRVQRYQEVGRALNADPRIRTLLTSEIGGLGWAFRKRIFDGAGLVSPEAIRFHPMKVPEERRDGGWGAIPPAFARLKDADAIVTYPILGEALMRDPLLSGYVCSQEPAEPPQFRDDEMWGSKYLLVCLRKQKR